MRRSIGIGVAIGLACLGRSAQLNWQSVRVPNGVVQVLGYTDHSIRIRILRKPGTEEDIPTSLFLPAPTKQEKLERTERGHVVIFRDAGGSVQIDTKTGTIRFTNSHGKFLTSVKNWTVSSKEILAAGHYNTAAAFNLQSGEAIYGLGQHPSVAALDNVGREVVLQQTNGHVALPIAMSNKGYGVMWNNPSITDVQVGAVSTFARFGFQGSYYEGENFEKKVFTRSDDDIDFNWDKTPPPGITPQNFSVRWTGSFVAPVTGVYKFETASDDGVRLWINDRRIVNDWTVHALTSDEASMSLKKGLTYHVRLDYFQAGGGASVQFKWQVPGQARPMNWRSEAGNAVDFCFMFAPKLSDGIRQYRALTGAAPLLPEWAYGFWQCKEHYNSESEIVDVLKHYRENHIPIDAVIQDWFYWNPFPWGSHAFDPKRYPHPTQMVSDIHALHGHIIISVWAKFQAGSKNFDALKSSGFLYTQTGDASYYDAFNPLARKMYWSQINHELFAKGFDGWWLDASEPELSSNWGEFRTIQTALGPGSRVFNAYPLMTTTAVAQGQRKANQKKRVFILTRSAFLGQQRNSAVTWSGDIQGTWEVLRNQIPAGLNFCLSGIPYWNTDIGGFFGGNPQDPKYAELFTRWFQFGSFCPMFRVHGTNFPKEMWRFSPAIEKILVHTDELHYRLLPYIYSSAWRVTHDGSTLMRGLPYDFQTDPNVANITNEFMYGRSILVCPVTDPGVTNSSVYLPASTRWFNFWTGDSIPGGRSIVAAAPISRLPLFVKAGSIVPLGPVEDYTRQKGGPVEVRIYPGKDAAFTWYADAGDGYGYSHGEFATFTLRWNNAAGRFSISAAVGDKSFFPQNLQLRLVVVRPGVGVGLGSSASQVTTVRYKGRPLSVRL